MCGYDSDFPWGEDGKSPTFMTCRCCGVEFGHGDTTWRMIRQWRDDWIAQGARWADPNLKPGGWSLEVQLKQIPPQYH